MVNNIGIVVGRFQVPTPTEAHIELLTYAMEKYDTVLIFVGSSPSPNRDNIIPNNIIHRIIKKQCNKLIHSLELNTQAIVSNIQDVYDYKLWSYNLDIKISKLIEVMIPNGDEEIITLVGGRDSFLDTYCGIYKNLDRFESRLGEVVSARNMRDNILKCGAEDNIAFLKGMIYQRLSMYHTSYQTVDICIAYKDYLLLGRRSTNHKYRFVGGFSDPNSNSLEEDAIRETKEETGLEVYDPQYITSIKIDDKRYAGSGDCIKTALFYAESTTFGDISLVDTIHPNGFDDMPYIRWIKRSELQPDMLVNEHIPLYNILKSRRLV